MIELRSVAEGVLLPVQAQPRAKRNGIVGEHAGRLKVAVTAVPEKGKANDAILDVLATELGLRRQQVALHAGASSTKKTVLVTGIAADELASRIGEHL